MSSLCQVDKTQLALIENSEWKAKKVRMSLEEQPLKKKSMGHTRQDKSEKGGMHPETQVVKILQ